MKSLYADLGLLSVTVFWGSTFILSKILLEDMPLSAYLFFRLGLAAFLLTVFARLRFPGEWNSAVLKHGAVLGVILFSSYYLQMWGIQGTSASNAGFITGLSVVLVPVFGYVFYRIKSGLPTWIGAFIAVTGLLFLSGANPFTWKAGDLKVLSCAIIFAFHIIYTGRFSRLHNVYVLTAVQLIVVAVLAFLFYLPEATGLPTLTLSQWGVIFYLAIFGTVFTYLMQTSMQRFTTVARTAIIFSMEPLFAALFAFLIAGEKLTTKGWIGGGLIVLAMIIAELPWQKVSDSSQDT